MLDVQKLIKRCRQYRGHYTWASLKRVDVVLQQPGVLLALGQTPTGDTMLIWGAETFEALRAGLGELAGRYRFTFVYTGALEAVRERTGALIQDGLGLKAIYLRYDRNLSATCPSDVQPVSNTLVAPVRDPVELLELDAALFDSLNLTPGEVSQWIRDENRLALGLRLDEALRGYALLELHGADKSQFFIRNMGVVEGYRRQGWGRRLLHSALAWAHEKDAKKGMLWVETDNGPARRLYERAGFTLNPTESEAHLTSG